jgi:hypothetical protein
MRTHPPGIARDLEAILQTCLEKDNRAALRDGL